MKIVYIVSSPHLNIQKNTGYGRHIRETVSGLEALGHSVKIIEASLAHSNEQSDSNTKTSAGFSTFKKYIPNVGWETMKDLNFLRLDMDFRKRVKKFISEENPDVIYERTSYLSNLISLKSHVDLPWVLEVNAPIVEKRISFSGNSVLTGFARRLEFEKYSAASKLFCVSDVLASYLSKEFKVEPGKIVTNHNGVDVEVFSPGSDRPEGGAIVFGFVGSIMPYHGIESLMNSFYKLYTQFKNIRLMIVGDGYNLGELRAKSISEGLENVIQFTGGIKYKDIPAYIEEMDVCIMPKSNWYGSPVKLFEYGALSKSVIAPKTPAVEEIIEDRVDGILVNSDEQLFEAMKELYQAENLRHELGQNLRSKLLSRYKWEDNVRKIADSLEALL